MKAIRWERGLFRLYVVLNVIGILFAGYSLYLYQQYLSVVSNAKFAETRMIDLEKALNAVAVIYDNSPDTSDDELARKLREQNISEDSVGLILYHARDYEHCYFGDNFLASKKEPVLISFERVMKLYRDDAERCRNRVYPAGKIYKFGISVSGVLILLPWFMHYITKFLILPITRWIASGFKSAGDGDAP